MNRKPTVRCVQRAVQRVARSDAAVRRRHRDVRPADPDPQATVEADGPKAAEPRKYTRFQPGNREATKHYVYTERLPPGLEHLPAQLDQFMSAQLTDEGDEPDKLTARRRSLLSHRVFVVERNIRKLAHTLDQKGLIDSKGKLRVQWLQMLATYIDKAIRLDTLLGLDRKTRPVKQTTREWLLEGPPHDRSRHSDHGETD